MMMASSDSDEDLFADSQTSAEKSSDRKEKGGTLNGDDDDAAEVDDDDAEDFLALNESDDNDDHDDRSSDMDVSTGGDDDPRSYRQKLPPWMEYRIDRRLVHPLVALHNEIVWFCNLMEPSPVEIRERHQLVERIRAIVDKGFHGKARLEVFGSLVTGLLLPSSDIDLVILTNRDKEVDKDETDSNINDKEQEGWTQTYSSPLMQFADNLHDEMRHDLSYFEVIENTRVPLVKFAVASSGIAVDVSFDQPTGPPAADLMKTYMDALSPLRPLTFVLKYFLAARGLNEPYSGGVGSYMLQLLIVAFLQHHERDAYNFRRHAPINLGSLLLEFFEMFGLDFNYMTTGLSVRYDGFFFHKGDKDRKESFWQESRPNLMALENPLDPTMDVGKSSFRFQMVQRAFAVAYRMLLAHLTAPEEPFVRNSCSILASIIPPTEEMVQRRWTKKQERSLSSRR